MIGYVNYTLMIYEKRFLDEGNQNLQVCCRYKVMVGRLVLANAMIPPFPSLGMVYAGRNLGIYFEQCS